MNEIMIDLQGGAKAPLYEKIYEYIKNEIVDGKISKGEKLPSTRLLAKNLSVSRSTVELAYDQLLAEGYKYCKICRTCRKNCRQGRTGSRDGKLR